MRLFLRVLLLLCLGCGQGWAQQPAVLTWQGFLLPASERGEALPTAVVAGNVPEDAPAPAVALVAFTLRPPSGMYHYGPGTKEGFPTTVAVTFAPVSPFAAKAAPGTQAFA
ncbi:MAG: hypothetical protein LBQ16_07665, partial [Gracilibacteraceae bacterium]|nr:hypothetical protein [Gracilibacteraceae bacterium]